MPRFLALIIALTLWLPARPALADKAAAAALFEEGRKLMESGDFASACDKFAASHGEDASVGALLNLARCREKQGRFATAWAIYREASTFAARTGDAERARIAGELAAALRSRGLPTLTIRVLAPVEGLTILRNGEAVAAGTWGSALPVDPAGYRLEAAAPGYAGWSATVTVGPSDHAVVEVPALALEDGGAGEDGGMGAQAIAGWVAIGVGGASLAVSAIFGGLTLKDKSKADDKCPDKVCEDEAGLALIERAQDRAIVSTVTLVAGAVLAAGGLTLVLTAPDGDAASAVVVTPFVGPVSGLTLRF